MLLSRVEINYSASIRIWLSTVSVFSSFCKENHKLISMMAFGSAYVFWSLVYFSIENWRMLIKYMHCLYFVVGEIYACSLHCPLSLFDIQTFKPNTLIYFHIPFENGSVRTCSDLKSTDYYHVSKIC